jgi:FKBP-type peptidyl-prolyl cis-trans isomerase FklB
MQNLQFGFRRQALSLVILSAFATLGAAQTPPANRPPPSTAEGADPGPPPTPEQMSYLFGLVYGARMHNTGITPDSVRTESVARGIKDGLQGKEPTVADQQQVDAYARSMAESMLARNEAAAKDFLARNARERGVITTASGLQYKILKVGDKKAPPIGPTDTVTVDYRGKLMNGIEFDSSYARGMPTTFPVNGVIRGWQEALVMMKPGATWRLFVPPELADGRMSKPKIPPNSLLIFDVDLKSVAAANAPPQAPPGTPRPNR